MSHFFPARALPALLFCLLLGLLLGQYLFQPGASQAQPRPGETGLRYTVVFTEGTNLCVTDNHLQKLFFYTVDPGSEPGADLKLRGTLNLSEIGQEVLRPKLLKKQLKDK